MKREKLIEFVWLVAVVVLFVFSIKFIRSGELQEHVAAFGIWAPLVVLVLKMMTLIIAPLGGTPLYVLAGALFGSFNGFILVLLGDVLGSTTCFYLSRFYGERVMRLFVGKENIARVLKTVSLIDNGTSFTKARLAFVSIPELLAYAAGLSKIRFWKFTLINTLFYIPVDLALVFLGAQIREFSARYFILIPSLLIAAAAIGFYLLYRDYQKAEGM